MKISLKQAFRKIGRDRINNIESKNYYLNAVISVLPAEKNEIDNFIFTFLNPNENMIIQVVVSDSRVDVKEPQKGTHPTQEKLDMNSVNVYPKIIIKKALQEFKKLNQPMSQMIVALEQNKWKVTVITKLLQVFVIEFDTKTGEVKGAPRVESLTKIS